ncbi:CAP domain-containing protein [Kitasatospora sp. NPDC049285]|uniref:CAP domain-containing protein n=1 Tax=Kitasatospora sp. NPDC049285 TaxID=3157096 RepID=UPI00343DBAAA
MPKRKPTRGNRKPARSTPQRRPAAARPAPPAAPAPVRAAVAVEEPWQEARSAVRPTGGDAARTKVEDAVLVLVNERRRRAGLAVLTVDERLRTSARRHSADMAARRYFAHVAPDGATPSDRMRAAGYPQPAAENLAMGQRTAHEVVHAWWNSPGHRRNLLHPEARTLGVGLHHGPDGTPEGPWWTQHFGYPL